ncbi:MAG: preprotein translocase subunit SecE [Alphaproteobacteria bacterium]|nr:preprotein translocase subunit SecE [Alphaproteobacteria bacterium]
MKQLFEYIKSVRLEWFKIVWPTRDMVIRATIMIFIFAGLLSLFLFFIDGILNWFMGLIF